MVKMSAFLMPLSQKLQSVDLDIFKVNDLIVEILSILQDWRTDSIVTFAAMFRAAESICHKLDVQINTP